MPPSPRQLAMLSDGVFAECAAEMLNVMQRGVTQLVFHCEPTDDVNQLMM
jgi:hypothetical protein